MSPAPSQLKQLQRELASGQVVVVVGSGVLVAACGQQRVEGHQVASWRGLLEHGVERLSGIGAADGDEELSRSPPPAPWRPRPAGGPASRGHKPPFADASCSARANAPGVTLWRALRSPAQRHRKALLRLNPPS